MYDGKRKYLGVTGMIQLQIYANKISISKEQFFKQYEAISKNEPHHVILESGRGGRYSMAGLQPSTIMMGRENKLEIKSHTGMETIYGNPLESMKKWMDQYKLERNNDLPDFQGGAIGYLSYDYVRYIERLPEIAEDDNGIPEIYFMFFDEWFVYDHESEVLWIMAIYRPNKKELAIERVEKWTKLWLNESLSKVVHVSGGNSDSNLDFSMGEQRFKDAVKKIQNYISQGDVFQVNLSVRQTAPLHVPAVEVYKTLRTLNPSPYMGYLHTPDFQLVSGSPELLIKKNGKDISTRPIAGTRSRGKNGEEDIMLANELIENEKERAEHVMLVDLERNDLGRVSAFGTVEVNEFMVIEKYSHVMHIVSNVRGELAENKNWLDLINATFPGGTITGAPKVRTMEIIEELEPVRRGPYTGSLGWISFNGDIELNIIIRTMLVKDGQAHIQAGAGIVIDSKPEHEYKESLKKAMALWKAKELAEAGGNQ